MGSVNLNDVPVTPTPYGRWQQLNAVLNVNAFGINAVVCEPGEDIGIEHDESETGQQEAYIVVSGRAAFKVGDQKIEAGPGTVVAAPDPAVTRGFEALEPDTRIVCVGATPTSDKQPFGEWIAEAASA
jgi:mannose-6-phosphate isomerase-like protein (cupin superfamily)